MQVARQGGEIARNARMELEEKTGKAVISPMNAKDGLLLNKKEESEEGELRVKTNTNTELWGRSASIVRL